jgi:lysozyme
MSIYGIDLCSIQGHVDWDKVAASGIKFAYIKASQFSSTMDYSFGENARRAKEAGLAVGAYHFAFCQSDPEAQARFFFRASDGVGQAEGELPPVLDLEFSRDMTPKPIVEWAVRFMAEAERLWYPNNPLRIAYGSPVRRPMLYTYPAFAKSLQPLLKASELTKYGLWIASYKANNGPGAAWTPGTDDKPTLPEGWDDYNVWQYSGNGGIKVPGIGPDCDRNVIPRESLFLHMQGKFQVADQPIIHTVPEE